MPDQDHSKQKKLTPKEAKLKASHFCAYQERSQQEVRDKLYEFGLYQSEVEEVLTELIVEGFINEERFAKAYIGGKFRMKKWGRVKILQSLKPHNISQYCINKGLQEIDEEEYIDTLKEIISKKSVAIKAVNNYEHNHKLARYAISRGFEPDLVWEILKSREAN